MKRPKHIKARMTAGSVALHVVGYRNKNTKPYLTIETSTGAFGYIEDRDVKRLRAWCDDCLKLRRKRGKK